MEHPYHFPPRSPRSAVASLSPRVHHGYPNPHMHSHNLRDQMAYTGPDEMNNPHHHQNSLPPHFLHPHDGHTHMAPLGAQIEDHLQRFQPPLGEPAAPQEATEGESFSTIPHAPSIPRHHGMMLPSIPPMLSHRGFHRGDAEAEIEEIQLWIEAEEARHEAEIATQQEKLNNAVEMEKKRHLETMEVFRILFHEI